MKILELPRAFSEACGEARKHGGRLGLVPTMGALHAGHLTLVDALRAKGCVPAVTIFVNPTQFGPNEDLAKYPRTLEQDLRLCEERGVELVFTPRAADIYPTGEQTRVRIGQLAEVLCGAARPGHFEGVTTVVTKLLSLAGPCVAAFGRKDYQQLKVIQRMVADLFLPVEILPVPIVREPDGLAMSSRNRYLTADERTRALAIHQGLTAACQQFGSGVRNSGTLKASVVSALGQAALDIDYVTLADPETLGTFRGTVPDRVLLAVAAFCGNTRLIDNVLLGEETLGATP